MTQLDATSVTIRINPRDIDQFITMARKLGLGLSIKAQRSFFGGAKGFGTFNAPARPNVTQERALKPLWEAPR